MCHSISLGISRLKKKTSVNLECGCLINENFFSYCKKDYHLEVVKACLVFIRYQISEPMNTFWKWKIPEIIEGMPVFSGWLHSMSTNCTASRYKWGSGGGLYKFHSFLAKSHFRNWNRMAWNYLICKEYIQFWCVAKWLLLRLWLHWFVSIYFISPIYTQQFADIRVNGSEIS